MIQNGDKLLAPAVCDGATWTTERRGSPSVLKFSVAVDAALDFTEGNPVRLTVDGQNVFYGFVFTKKRDKQPVIDVTAYDQTRYLKNKDVYVYENKTASEVIAMIAADFNLNLGSIEPTTFTIPSRVEDNATLFDIIYNALDLELIDLIEAPDGEAPFEAVDDDIFRADLRGGLEAALSNLPQNQSEVIRSRYFDGKTKRRTAIEMGETEGQVGCAERNALQKMRSDYRLRTFSDTILDKTAYRGTGLGAFREDRASSVEMAVMAVERLNEQISNCRIGGQDDGRIGGNEYGSI